MRSKPATVSETPARKAPERSLPTHGGEWERRGDVDVPVNGNEGPPKAPEPPAAAPAEEV